MKLNEYQILAARTINNELTTEQKIQHAIHGMWSEYGEIRGIFQKELQGHPISKEHLKKEIGDLFWMTNEIAVVRGITFDETMEWGSEYKGESYEDWLYDVGAWIQDTEMAWKNFFYAKREKKAITNIVKTLVSLCLSLDIDYEEVLQMNIDKLIARYPNGFESEKSLHRKEGDI